MTNKKTHKEIYERISDARAGQVLLGDIVKCLKFLNEDIENIVEVGCSCL